MTYIVHLVLTLFFLILTLDLSFAQGDLSATLQGQASSAKLTVGTIQVPNNLATKTGSINALIETGNQNILVNPSHEHITAGSGWTFTHSGANDAQVSTTAIHGKQSFISTASSESFSLSQTSTLYSSQFADGVQGLASIRVKTDHTGTCSVCSVQNSTVSTTNCVTVQANNKWGLYKVPFILGSTNNGISLACTSGTGTTYVDDAFVGAVDLQASVDQSRIAGEAYFAGTSSCTWSRTSTTIGPFGTTAACPGPTIVTSSMGSWQTTDSDLPRVTVNNLPAGTYKATFLVPQFMTAAAAGALAINDGTTTCEPNRGTDNTNYVLVPLTCTFTYASSGNRSFEIYGASVSSTINVSSNLTSPRASLKFILEYFGSGSVYTSTNADTDWASCGHTPSDFTGFGTVTNIETQCKREGSDLLMRGKFTSGTTTGVEARLNLKLGGTALTSASSSSIPSLQKSGDFAYSATSAISGQTLMEPSVTYITWGVQSSGASGIAKATGLGILATTAISFNARIPISGWTNSNIIIGQFNGLESCANTLECTDTFSAKVSSTGVVSGENVDWINGNCTFSSGAAVCTFNNNIFTVAPNCVSSTVYTVGTGAFTFNTSASTTVANISTLDANNTVKNEAFNLICQKQGADYIGKTAKAVASDQNIATPGVTKVKACYYAFGGASATLASPTNCTGTCTEVVDTCGAGSIPTRSGTGVYTNLTFANGTFANSSYVKCECEAYDTGTGTRSCVTYFDTGDQTWSSTSSGGAVINVATANLTGTLSDTYVSVKCEGQGP